MNRLQGRITVKIRLQVNTLPLKAGAAIFATAMTDRRFNEAEVAAIFERAAEAQQTPQRQLPSGEGMTLAELQEIGREIGIAPELVEQAAKSIALSGRSTSRQFLGLPIGVGRTVDLDRKLSNDEWEHFVVDLRETFDARGNIKQDGSLRQWTNGNLQALLEPTATGHRIRLKTIKGDAMSLMFGGLVLLGAGTASFIAVAMRAGLADAGVFAAQGFLGIMGAGMFSLGALRLPGWARLRRRQMEEVAARVAAAASSEPERTLPGETGKGD